MSPRKRPDGCCPPRKVPPLRSAAANARLVAGLRAAGHQARLRMLQLLAEAGAPVCVCDITPLFRLSQPTVSHHLKVLREAGLVSAERRGIWNHYALRPGGMEVLRAGVADLAGAAAGGGDRLVGACVRARRPGSPGGEGRP